MKVSVWRNFVEAAESIDFEFDASNKDEVQEVEKYATTFMGIFKGKELTDEEIIEMVKQYMHEEVTLWPIKRTF